MGKRILRLTPLLIAASAINLLVAWGCALWSDVRLLAPTEDLDHEFWPRWEHMRGVGLSISFESNGGYYGVVRNPEVDMNGLIIWRAGLPMRAFEATSAPHAISLHDAATTLLQRGFRVKETWTSFEPGRRLPVMPLPLGFAVNTLLYALLLWLAIAGPGRARHWRRRRGGRCLDCGYPRTGLTTGAACPECGAAASGASTAAM